MSDPENQKNFPGIAQITGLNDEFHEDKAPNSAHTKGEAVDFTLKEKITDAQGKALVKALQAAGFGPNTQDEYNHPSKGSSGAHIHAQLKDGAIVNATSGGRTVNVGEGSRPEGVFPIDDNHPVPMKLDDRQFSELVRILRDHKDISENLLSNS